MNTTICTEYNQDLDPDDWERTESVVIDRHTRINNQIEVRYHHIGDRPSSGRLKLDQRAATDEVLLLLTELCKRCAVVDLLTVDDGDRQRFGLYAHLCRTDLPPHYLTEAEVLRAALAAA